jgi:hypothetical protein
MNLHSFLNRHEFEIMKNYYGDRRAKRSNVPYINHIIEGLAVMSYRDDAKPNDVDMYTAMQAYTLHPIFQEDAELVKVFSREVRCLGAIGQDVVVLAMEYRRTANSYLSTHDVSSYSPSPLKEIREMLIADKVQNYKDFLTFHFETHPRRAELNEYFKNWFNILDISKSDWELYKQIMEMSHQTFNYAFKQ